MKLSRSGKKILQRLHPETVLLNRKDCVDSRSCSGNGGKVGDAAYQGLPPDRERVGDSLGAMGRVDNHGNITVLDRVNDVRTPLKHFVHGLDLNPLLLQIDCRTTRGKDMKTGAAEIQGDRHEILFIGILDAYKDLAAGRKLHPCPELGFRKSLGKGIVYPHDLAGRLHLRAENSIDPGEFDERKDRLLDRDV